MLSKVYGAGILGMKGYLVCCEADIGSGLPNMITIGYLASEVKEAQDRVKTAIKNSGYDLPPKKIVVNLSPANIKKEGCAYDLPIALSILSSYEIINSVEFQDSIFIGELSLGGDLLPIRGILSITIAAKEAGFKKIYMPKQNAKEGAAINGIKCFGIENLSQMVDILEKKIEITESKYIENSSDNTISLDFSDIRGQSLLKRASIIGVAGRHNLLYIGPAGTGKSMIASRIPSIMPKMSKEEQIEISQIYSICGALPKNGRLLEERPFRSPHHTISRQALIGGGAYPKPGEVSLSTHGVLFLDEFAEFKNDVIEVLRQPMEDKVVNISRVNATYTFPANFILCVATNPCKCGFYPDRSRCNCSEKQVKSYLGKISKPMLDRIDICIETKLLGYEELNNKERGKTSKEIRKEIEEVRKIQFDRFKNDFINYNGEMNKSLIDKHCKLSKDDEFFIKELYEKKSMSVRGLNKILKVARTIADLEESVDIKHSHLCEAISYRSLEDKYWGNNYADR